MPISHAAARVCAVICVTLGAFSASAEQRGQPRASTKAPTSIEQGPLAQACGVRGKALGSPVEKGPGKWKLYDTRPGSTAPRDFYLTGFSDGCPRRITAAVAMFGSVALYEAVHYGPVGLKPKGDATDAAYAQLLQSGHRPHFIGYYVIEMGLQGRPWNDCKGTEKTALRARFDALVAQHHDSDRSELERMLDVIGVRAP